MQILNRFKDGVYTQNYEQSLKSSLKGQNVLCNLNNAVFYDVKLCGSCKNRRFGGVRQRNIPEEGIRHSHRRENLKSYIASTGWDL
jgi:sulfur relay (sulfurtransferase) complex TusBCD TusD component (DsrE family)